MEAIESLSITEFENKLSLRKPFSAYTPSKSLLICVQDIQPLVGICLHSGHHLREELESLCNLKADERFYEEDPYLELFIQPFPIQIIARDSRYEYDLNRNLEKCIYQTPAECWGKNAWKQPLNEIEKGRSLEKYRECYQYMHALLDFLQRRFGKMFVLNQHSYNYQRIPESTPMFDVLTKPMSAEHRWLVDETIAKLSKLNIQGMQPTCLENRVFANGGYFSEFFHKTFPSSACLTIEIKKIFMDELQGNLHPEIAKNIRKPYSEAILELGKRFISS